MAEIIETTKLAGMLASVSDDQGKYARLTNNQLELGSEPFNMTHVVDFSLEAIRPVSVDNIAQGLQVPTMSPTPSIRTSRRTGRYELHFKGTIVECRSLKELLSEGLKALELHRQGTLDQLSAIMPRSKRIVARDPGLLFNKKELSEKYSEKLIDDWWYGTNNSSEETISWLRRASEMAGLQWGKDISTNL